MPLRKIIKRTMMIVSVRLALRWVARFTSISKLLSHQHLPTPESSTSPFKFDSDLYCLALPA